MRVRDLGPLAVAVDTEEHAVVGTRGPAMLALLAANANQRVSVHALMEAAWGEQISAGAGSTLESHIWRLRQLLEPGRARGQAPTVLVNDAGGYRLVAGSSSLDSLFFEECAAEVRDLLAAGRPGPALRRADTGLRLWRGRPYGGFADAGWAQAAVARLEEVWGQLQERRVEALLATGAVDVALSSLQPLVSAMPYRETLRGLQMRALYRSGRAEQALQVYQDTRRTMVDEVGIDPGPELQELHRQILNQDVPGVEPAPPGVDPARAVEVHLPPTPTELIGREEGLARLVSLVGERRLVTITGPAGCGKTRLAVEIARTAAPSFPDGVWFVDLAAVTDPDLVVDVIVSTIGFAASVGATPAEDLRSYLRTRRMLVVLDNCEHVLAGVAAVVSLVLDDPGAELDGRLLATSREPVNVGGETVWSLPPLGLPSGEFGLYPTAAPAVELFLQRLRAAAPTLRVDEQVLARVVQICVAVDGLPLALELAASRAPSYTLDDIAAQVAGDVSRLGRIGRGPDDHRTTLRSTVEWSHRLLSPGQQRAHRRLSVLPGRFTSASAAAVVDDLDAVDTEDLLAQLVHRSMLSSDGARLPGRPTTFRQLVTVRSHARHALADAEGTAAGLDRRDAWTAALVAARPALGGAAEPAWYSRIDDDYDTVRATLARHLIEQPDALGGRIATRLSFYWYYREQLVEGLRWLQLGYDVLRADEPTDRLLAQMALASVLAVRGRVDLARPHVEAVLDDLGDPEPERLVEIGEGLVGLAASAWVPDAHDLVMALHRQLTRVVDRSGSGELALLADAVGCIALFAAGRIPEAVSQAHEVEHRAAAADNLMATWIAAGSPTVAALLAADPAEGVPWVNRLMRAHLRLGTGAGGSFLETRASFAALAGEHRHAVRLYAAAHNETRRAAMRWPRRPVTHQLLAQAREALAPADYQHAWQEGEGLSMADVLRSG